jgi:hypothetical protein
MFNNYKQNTLTRKIYSHIPNTVELGYNVKKGTEYFVSL